jgi:plasmid stabilization system protein ParE
LSGTIGKTAAKRDLKDIISYLYTLSHEAALKYYDIIIEKIGDLGQMPERCPFVRNITLKAKGYRCLVVENYLVIYVVKGDAVQIHRIIYGKQNYEWLL